MILATSSSFSFFLINFKRKREKKKKKEADEATGTCFADVHNRKRNYKWLKSMAFNYFKKKIISWEFFCSRKRFKPFNLKSNSDSSQHLAGDYFPITARATCLIPHIVKISQKSSSRS